MRRPAADRDRKTDRHDAEFLARLLATRNVVEVRLPDGRTEAARDLSRALARKVAEAAGRPEWKPACDALRCVKGIDVARATGSDPGNRRRSRPLGGHSSPFYGQRETATPARRLRKRPQP
ncbi:MAG: hypothetical protein Q4B91_08855 [Atopobiaceae bacterium]|nr:hypothetical protein [Atopobiaceae bacterium]